MSTCSRGTVTSQDLDEVLIEELEMLEAGALLDRDFRGPLWIFAVRRRLSMWSGYETGTSNLINSIYGNHMVVISSVSCLLMCIIRCVHSLDCGRSGCTRVTIVW